MPARPARSAGSSGFPLPARAARPATDCRATSGPSCSTTRATSRRTGPDFDRSIQASASSRGRVAPRPQRRLAPSGWSEENGVTCSQRLSPQARSSRPASPLSARRRKDSLVSCLLGALEVHPVSRIDPHPLAFADEFGDLNHDAIAQPGGLGARCLGGGLHHRGGFHDLQLRHGR